MKVNEEKLVQIAVDYVAALVSGNGARVRNKSSQGMLIETDRITWQLKIERRKIAILPKRHDAYIVATSQLLRDAVKGVEHGYTIEHRRMVQEHIRDYNATEWMFEIEGDPVRKRLVLGDQASDNSQMAVAVRRCNHPYFDDACDVAMSLVEMCNASVTKSLWMITLYEKPPGARKWIEYVKLHHIYGASHLLMTMIELLTRRQLIPPGHGLCGVPKTL